MMRETWIFRFIRNYRFNREMRWCEGRLWALRRAYWYTNWGL